jgi:transcriptional regulator of acetoin/glycerol metabolism
LRLPALRDRRDELLALFSLFIGDLPFGRTVAETLLLYDWPENVRELEHVAAYIKLFAEQAGHVHQSHLPEQFQGTRGTTGKLAKARDANRTSYGNLKALLEKHEGNISQVAADLGVYRQQAYRWIKKANLDPKDFRR